MYEKQANRISVFEFSGQAIAIFQSKRKSQGRVLKTMISNIQISKNG